MDILHRVGIKSSVDKVYQALATRDGLAAWWTDNTQGESKVGQALQFRFSFVETGQGAPNPNDPHISGDGPD